MKRRLLEKQLRRAGCYLKREGAEHALWTNPKTGITETISRDIDIKEGLANKILKKLT